MIMIIMMTIMMMTFLLLLLMMMIMMMIIFTSHQYTYGEKEKNFEFPCEKVMVLTQAYYPR